METYKKYAKKVIKKEEWNRCSEDYVIDVNKRQKFEEEVGKKKKKFKVTDPKFTE